MVFRERRGGRALFSPCFPFGGWTTVIKERKTSVQITVFNQSAWWEMICTSSSVWIALPLARYLCQPCQRHDGRAIGLLPIQREGVSFHFSQWVFATTVSTGTPSWPPFDSDADTIWCTFPQNISVNGYAWQFLRERAQHNLRFQRDLMEIWKITTYMSSTCKETYWCCVLKKTESFLDCFRH